MRKSIYLISAIGFSLIILGGVRALGYVEFNSVYLFGISLAALFFTIAEFAYSEKLKEVVPAICYALAMCALLIFPHMIEDKRNELGIYTDTATLVALGLVILTIAINTWRENDKNERTFVDYERNNKEAREIVDEMKDTTVHTHESTNELIAELKKQNKIYSERLDLYEQALSTNDELRSVIVKKDIK